ncbi:glycosyltransferase [Thalassotalea nanhaiensis]|uniref:Glycosyltransferase n=1 Tax=Thalassotalea nanhaiensis TaxID=3065648 RepID=A0ABY9TPI2_9GAMM|nr:glycosyltransferase [Colwelliaceae bacterium SQ345]
MSKVLVVTSSLGGGGAERVAVDVSNGFFDCGDFVSLYALKDTGAYKTELNRHIKVLTGTSDRASANLLELIKVIRKTQPEIVFCSQNYLCFIVFIAVKLSFKTRVQVVVREGSTPSKNIPRNLKGLLLKYATKIAYSYSNLTVATCEYVKKDMEEYLKIDSKKISVINNPIDINEITLRSKESVDNILFSNDYPIVSAVGRLHKVKDFGFLIKMINFLKSQNKFINLLIIGEGEERGALEALINEYKLEELVKLMGFVSNPFPYIKNSNLLVLSSHFEGYPNVVNQALALNTSVVAIDVPGAIKEMLPSKCIAKNREIKEFSSLVLKNLNAKPEVNQLTFLSSKEFAMEVKRKLNH